jgi:hypothetical protein
LPQVKNTCSDILLAASHKFWCVPIFIFVQFKIFSVSIVIPSLTRGLFSTVLLCICFKLQPIPCKYVLRAAFHRACR